MLRGIRQSPVFTVIVNDTQLPVITCPGNIAVVNDNNVCGATVTYSVTSSDTVPVH